MPEEPVTVHRDRLRLRHPELAFWVTSRSPRRTAAGRGDLADEPDIVVGDEPREALRAALAALGEPWASETVEGAELP